MPTLELIDGFSFYGDAVDEDIKTAITASDHWASNIDSITLKNGWDPNNSNYAVRLEHDHAEDGYLLLNPNYVHGSGTPQQYVMTGARVAVGEAATGFWGSPNLEILRVANGLDRWRLTSGYTQKRMRLWRGTTVPISDGFSFAEIDCTAAGFDNPIGIAEPFYVELFIKGSLGSDGFVILRINGRQVYRFDGQTCASSPYLTNFQVNTHAYNRVMYIGDVYVQSGSDSQFLANNQGQFYVAKAIPTSDVNTLWTPSNAGDLYVEIDEYPSDGDASSVYSDKVGDFQKFGMGLGGLTLDGFVRAVSANASVKHDNAGPANVLFKQERSAVESEWADKQLSEVYEQLRIARLTDPETDLSWDATDLANTDFGVEVGTGHSG